MSTSNTFTLTFSWDQLARELERMAAGDTQKVMIPYLVSSLQKQHAFMNSELLLREIVSTVACVSDQDFPQNLAGGFNATGRSRDSPSSH